MNALTSDKHPLGILHPAQSTVGPTLARTLRASLNTTTSAAVLDPRGAHQRCPPLAWSSWWWSAITSRLRGLPPCRTHPGERHRMLRVIREHPVAARRLVKAAEQVVAR
jgi:hypothetical protein